MKQKEPQRKILDIFYKSVEAVDPYRAVSAKRDQILALVREKRLEKICLVGFGKAAVPMAKALLDNAGDIDTSGILITKYGHVGSESFDENILVCEAGHPVPDESGYKSTQKALGLLQNADSKTLVVFLISGGGSALLTSPCEGITLKEKQMVTDLLLKAGANIKELNTIRKHISAVKGGRLAEVAHPASCMSLILSDVIGDPLDAIASGPTVPDPTTYGQACSIINKYDLAGRIPERVMEHLNKGEKGVISETPKHGAPAFHGTQNIIVASNTLAIEAAKKAAEAAGYKTTVLSTELSGEASDAARYLVRSAREFKKAMAPGEKACLIAGGETTVTVKGEGKGGRNTEMALVFGMEIDGETGIEFMSAGTDGQDGPTDAAGAIADGNLVSGAVRLGVDPKDFLVRNDSYNFFAKTGGLIISGPTGTNVMDIQVIFLEK
jgi:glycerate 2-kinase